MDGAGNLYFTDSYNGVLYETPKALINQAPKSESLAAGRDSLPAIVPSSAHLLPPFAPSSDSSWLTIGGTTNGVVSFSFTTNLGLSRTGHITLLGQSVSVAQSGPLFSLGTTALTVGPAAGSNSVVLSVVPNIGVWSARSVGWLHVSPASQSGTGSTNVIFSYDANPGTTRSGAILIAGQLLFVTQAGSNYVAAPLVTPLVSSGLLVLLC